MTTELVRVRVLREHLGDQGRKVKGDVYETTAAHAKQLGHLVEIIGEKSEPAPANKSEPAPANNTPPAPPNTAEPAPLNKADPKPANKSASRRKAKAA